MIGVDGPAHADPRSPLGSHQLSTPILQIQNLQVQLRERLILNSLSFSLQAGEFVMVMGPSGSGKSTLLKSILGLLPAQSGEIHLAPGKKMAMVFQEPCLLSWRTARENVSLPLTLGQAAALSESQARLRAQSELCKVGLQAAEDHFPHELSGGMKMRTSLARAMAQDPDLLLLDEPFSALDEPTRFELQSQLRKIFCFELQSRAVIFVTHSLTEAVFLGSRILFLNSRGELKSDAGVCLPQERTESLRYSSEYFAEIQRLQVLQKLSGEDLKR